MSIKGKLECDLFSAGLNFYKPYIEVVFCYFAVEIFFFVFAFLFVYVFLKCDISTPFYTRLKKQMHYNHGGTAALLDLLREAVSDMVLS